MTSDNYVVIHGWMCNELELKGNELLTFAMIYSFSRDGASKFSGGRKYIADAFNISLPTVDKALQKLLDLNYIEKQSSEDYIHTDVYWANLEVVKKLYQGSKETLLGGSKETLHNKYSNNKHKDNNTLSKDNVARTRKLIDTVEQKKSGKSQYVKCMELIDDFTDDEVLRDYLKNCYKVFNENAREAGTPFYTNTFKGKINKLKQLSDDNYEQRQIVLQTLDNGWNSFYALKQDKTYGKKASSDIGYEIKRGDKKKLMEDIANGTAEKF